MPQSLPSADAYMDEPVRYPPLTIVDITAEAAAVSDEYRNQVLSQVNASCMRLAVMTGEYRWHHHPQADELFLVVDGLLEIDLPDDRTLTLTPWQCVVVPAGTIHRTRAKGRTVNHCFENLGSATVFVDR